jgi:hypothetical protein
MNIAGLQILPCESLWAPTDSCAAMNTSSLDWSAMCHGAKPANRSKEIENINPWHQHINITCSHQFHILPQKQPEDLCTLNIIFGLSWCFLDLDYAALNSSYYPAFAYKTRKSQNYLTASILTKIQNMQLPNALHYVTILLSKKKGKSLAESTYLTQIQDSRLIRDTLQVILFCTAYINPSKSLNSNHLHI